MKQLYQTVDGEIFDNAKGAREHEESAFKEWLDEVRSGTSDVTLADVLIFLNTCDDKPDEQYGTEYTVFTNILKTYWSNQ